MQIEGCSRRVGSTLTKDERVFQHGDRMENVMADVSADTEKAARPSHCYSGKGTVCWT